jgi:hypothetical protein
LKFNLNRFEMLLLKKGGSAKKHENWSMYDQPMKVADEMNYLGVTLERRRGWKRQKTKTVAKGNQTLLNVDNAYQEHST